MYPSIWLLLFSAIFGGQGIGIPFPGPGMGVTAACTGGPVAYEAEGAVGVANATSASFTITLGGASSSRGVQIQMAFRVNTVSGLTATVGGQAASLIPGTDSTNAYLLRSMIYGLKTTLTGAQTVAVAWTTSSNASIGAISATGVCQATPFNGGTFTGGTSASPISLTVISNSGDLTSTVLGHTPYNVAPTTNRTQKWSANNSSGATIRGAGDVGPGTGTTTHSWTYASFTHTVMSGANFVQ
jgi:hypothetical protein